MKQPPAPFSCAYSPNIPELLFQLNCTIAISTYQAGKVVLISAVDKERLVQLPRTFPKAMGIAVTADKLGVATKDEVLILRNSPRLASAYPRQPNTYDSMYMPRATYYTGQVDIHDLDWGTAGLWGVNTSFSCLALINEDYSFSPQWQPHFISHLASEDRCHLNGMALQNGEPTYVSALGSGDTPQSWRNNIVGGGVLMHVPSNEIIVKDLAMPHSPRIFDGHLYMLLSATGELIAVDVEKGTYGVIHKISGFVRGLAKHGDYLFIGVSRLRQNSSTFKHLAIAKLSDWAGILVMHLPTAAIVGKIHYQASVEEIYDVQVLPNTKRPNIINTMTEVHKMGLATPDATYWANPQAAPAKK